MAAGIVIATMLPLLSRTSDEQGAKNIADDLKTFKSGAEGHFQANRAAYQAAMTDGTGASTLCKTGVNTADGSGGTVANDTTLHTCAIDGTMLKYLQALPAGYRQNDAYGEQWVAVYRLVYSGGTPTGSVEAIFVSAAVLTGGGAVATNDRRFRIATNAGTVFGFGGGAVPDTDRQVCVAKRASATYEVCGDGWKVNLANFISSAQMTTFSNRLPN